MAAIAFVVGGVATILNLAWWPTVVIGAAVFSGLIIILFWNGSMQKLADQGVVGLLINIAIAAGVFILQSSDFEL